MRLVVAGKKNGGSITTYVWKSRNWYVRRVGMR